MKDIIVLKYKLLCLFKYVLTGLHLTIFYIMPPYVQYRYSTHMFWYVLYVVLFVSTDSR